MLNCISIWLCIVYVVAFHLKILSSVERLWFYVILPSVKFLVKIVSKNQVLKMKETLSIWKKRFVFILTRSKPLF